MTVKYRFDPGYEGYKVSVDESPEKILGKNYLDFVDDLLKNEYSSSQVELIGFEPREEKTGKNLLSIIEDKKLLEDQLVCVHSGLELPLDKK